MFGAGSLGPYGAAAAAGIPGWGGLPPGFPPSSSAAGLASLAAAQQAQQAAALASLGPAAGNDAERQSGPICPASFHGRFCVEREKRLKGMTRVAVCSLRGFHDRFVFTLNLFTSSCLCWCYCFFILRSLLYRVILKDR